ncbi:isoprenylcysteine carboxylmethyltransferase family protein [Mycolicibacterium gadium]|jgi:protein-S-isoprenylcysteine O-methyltransferase Ste14|uniref:methyltransferase family protein n=1 Tax=Mycolicibacterium gadium TaxID=1794 RepID=UPI002FDDD9C6
MRGSVTIIPKQKLVRGLVEPVVLGSALFLAAGTFDYWQAWVLLAVAALATAIPTVYLARTNPVALERRQSAGPTAETRLVQKVSMAGWWLSLAGMLLVSALDHRFDWSHVPIAVCLIGDVLVAAGLGLGMLALIQNSHAAATVRVEQGQVVIAAGFYGLVRHPMYTGNVLMMVGIPLALGSYWGLVFVIPGLIVLALRIRDEEKLLRAELAGYSEYAEKVRYRLVPYMW